MWMTGDGSLPLRFFLNLLSVFVAGGGCLFAFVAAAALGWWSCCLDLLGDLEDRMLAASASTPRRLSLDDDLVVLLELSSPSSPLSKDEFVELDTVRAGTGAPSSLTSTTSSFFVAAIFFIAAAELANVDSTVCATVIVTG